MADDPQLSTLLHLLAEARAAERRQAAARVRTWAEFVAAHRLKRIDKRVVEVWLIKCAEDVERG